MSGSKPSRAIDRTKHPDSGPLAARGSGSYEQAIKFR